MKRKFTFLIAAALMLLTMMASTGTMWGQTTVTYAQTSTTAVSVSSGTAPTGSTASFSTTYTNNKNQLTAGNYMTLTLNGYEGKIITGIVLSMHSNASKGSGYLSVIAGETSIASIGSSNNGIAFNNAAWYGSYTSNYVNVTITMTDNTYEIQEDESVVITIGATVNSLYCQSFTLTYEDAGGNPTCATPTFSPAAGTYTSAQDVTISTTTEGATIYYTTDGTDPTTDSNVYSSAINVGTTTTIKAIAVKEGNNNSSIASATYTILPVIHDGTEEDPYTVADARNAIDANTGLTNVYATGIVSEIVTAFNPTYGNITYNISSDGQTTSDQLQAYRGKSYDGEWFTSADDIQVGDVVVINGNLKKYNSTYEFEQDNELVSLIRKVATPTFYPEAGAVASGTGVTISCVTEGATIYYTTDGTNPTTSSNEYSDPIVINAATTIKAYAVKAGNPDSEIATAEYTILAPATTPTFSPEAGTYTWAQNVTISTTTEGATIYYTTDGSNPTSSSSVYSEPIAVNETKTIKAIAAKDGMANSDVAEATYTMNIPAINAENVNLAYDATAGSIAYTMTNPVDGGVLTAAITGGNEGTWLTLGDVSGETVALTCSANDGDADRSATVTLTYTYNTDKTVTKVVTVTQTHFVVDYAILPFEYEGGILSDFSSLIGTSYSLNDEGSYAQSNAPYRIKFTATGDYLQVKTDSQPGTVTVGVKVFNSGNNPKITVQGSIDGESFDDIEELTIDASTTGTRTLETTNAFNENHRYVRLSFTKTVNVGVGPIEIEQVLEQVATPTFSPAAGEYNVAQNVEISCETADATIYYTTDGTDPTTSSTEYTAAIPVATTMTIKAIAAKDGMANSAIATATYTINIPAITLNSYSIEAPDAGDSGTLEVTYHNITEVAAEVWFCNAEGTEEAPCTWITADINDQNNVEYVIQSNDSDARTAYFKVWAYDNNLNEVYSDLVTVTQEAHVQKYIVSFTLNGGTFVPNGDFEDETVEKEEGLYHLPSATKAGYTFDGWNDGTDTYAADAEYPVSDDVEFTAQWTEITTGTITFGSGGGNTNINGTSISGNDSMGNTWTITTEGTNSFTPNANYAQIGSGSSPATSITFTMTLPAQKTISAFSAKFGGFSGTAGTVTLKVGDETVGTGSLNASTDVTVNATNTTEVGTVLTVTVTNIAKGVKCYYISYTLSDAPVVPVINPTANPIAYNATTGSIDYTIDNYEEGTMTAATEATWISNIAVEAVDEIGEVTFNVTNNTSNESRSATVTLTFTYGDPAATVTKDVTVTQNGQPSVTVTPASAEVAFAGGAPEFAVTYESIEITDAGDFGIEFYETPSSVEPGTQPAWISNAAITGNTTDGFTLTVTVVANDGDARDAYLKVYAAGSNDYIYSNLVTINQAAFFQLTTYSLVTSVDDIVSGKHYIIASSATDGDAYAMGGQTSNNRSGVAVTIENGQISETENVYEFVINTHLNSNDEVDYYTIYDAATPGYLYAASSSKNYLRTETTLDNNGKWTISIATESSVASVVAQGSNTNKTMKFNSSNYIFSCYASGQSPIYLYVKDNDEDYEYYGMEITYTETSIPDGETLTVGAGSVMTITNNSFINNDPSNLVIEDGGQLITSNPVAATVKKAIANPAAKTAEGWYTIASPVNNVAPASVTNLISSPDPGFSYDLYLYDEPSHFWWNQKNDEHASAFTNLTNGRGYLYWNSTGSDLEFSGDLNVSAVEYTLTANATALTGFNLIGNPFSHDIYKGAGTAIPNSGASGYELATGFFTLTNAGAWQVGYDNSTAIKPCQGVLVQATTARTLTIANTTANGAKASQDFVEINVTNGQYGDVAYAVFSELHGLNKIDHLNAEIPMLYIPQNGEDYAIATMTYDEKELALNLKVATSGTYKLNVKAKGQYEYLHLIDNMTGADVDLLQTPSYSFTSKTTDYASRFRLVFSANGVNDDSTSSETFAFINGEEIVITNAEADATLQMVDMTGRILVNTKGVNRLSTAGMTQGVYVIRMVNGEKVKTQKIVVR